MLDGIGKVGAEYAASDFELIHGRSTSEKMIRLRLSASEQNVEGIYLPVTK